MLFFGQNRLRLAPTVNPACAAPRGLPQKRRARFRAPSADAPGLRCAPGVDSRQPQPNAPL